MGYVHSGYEFSDILKRRYSRRGVLRGLGVAGAVSAIPAGLTTFQAQARSTAANVSSLSFAEVARGLDETHHIAAGYTAQVLMRWGDGVLGDAPNFDPFNQTAKSQAKQFGFNNDFISYFPITGSEHGLLCVNHEYTTVEQMFSGGKGPADITDEQQRVDMEAVGCSVIEIRKEGREWKPVYGKYNRRISATTKMKLEGPAAGSDRLKTKADPTGTEVYGTFANCAGGQTPWGTYLTCEENADGYFYLDGYEGDESENHTEMTIGKKSYHRWDLVDERFNVKTTPNEPNRFHWVVEIDPFDPNSTPIKRTALGRCKHESATSVVSHDGRVVVYTGDDDYFQFIYKYVSNGKFNAQDKAANKNLLNDGTLYAARYDENGDVVWLPLIYGDGPLTQKNGFHSQADVLIDTRKAARLMGATPMDRPEDVDVNPATGKVYATMTKNHKREEANAVNRRAPNPMGYILEMIPPEEDGRRDHTADRFTWELFLEGGDPKETDYMQGSYLAPVSEHGWLACPDNLAFDVKGRMWITTDGQEAVEAADAVFAVDTEGNGRGQTRCFFRGPVGSEVTGPAFTPDGNTFFLSIQHPAEDSTFDEPSTRWPDFREDMPPRPAILAITKDDGGVIGG